MMDVSFLWVIFPNPLGIHIAGCWYASLSNIGIVVLFALLTRFGCVKDNIRNQFFVCVINSININY